MNWQRTTSGRGKNSIHFHNDSRRVFGSGVDLLAATSDAFSGHIGFHVLSQYLLPCYDHLQSVMAAAFVFENLEVESVM
jgi:hypothetical protein